MSCAVGRHLPGASIVLAVLVEVDEFLVPHKKIADIHVSIFPAHEWWYEAVATEHPTQAVSRAHWTFERRSESQGGSTR